MKMFWQIVSIVSFLGMGLSAGVILSPYLLDKPDIIRGDFKVFATLKKDNPSKLWIEVFNKDRGVGIAFSEDLFYTISVVVDETANTSLSINMPKLIPNDSMHPPERYCPECGYDLIELVNKWRYGG